MSYEPPAPPPPPPGGGYEPPPPPAGGGYGAPPPYGTPPAPGGYGGMPSQPFSVGDAFNYGWTKFQANIGPIVLAVLAIVAVQIILFVIQFAAVGAGGSTVDCEYNFATGNTHCDGGGGFFASLMIAGALGLVGLFISFVVYVGIVRAALDITYGRPVTVGSIFEFKNVGQVLLASIVIAVAYVVGLMLCVIPGIAVMFFTQYTAHFIVDKNMPALEAIKASVSFVNKNLGSLVGFFIASIVAYFVGMLACGIGVLVAIPVIVIASAYTYRKLQGEQVAV